MHKLDTFLKKLQMLLSYF